MHNTAERSLIAKIFTAVVILVGLALLAFFVKYTRDSFYTPDENTFYKVEYFNLDNPYDTAVFAANEELELPNLTRTGYTFSGWYLDTDGSLKVPEGAVVSGGLKLYAQWEINRYTVTAYPNYDGQAPSITSLAYQSNFIIDSPQRTGYAFVGWYSNPECTEPIGFSTMPDRDVEVYANWSINNYTLRLVVNTNEVPAITDQSIQYGTDIDLPQLQREGYTFAGWYRESALINQIATGTPMPGANLTLFAKWTPNMYALKFVTNGGSVISNIQVAYRSDISELVIPATQRPGYDFVHWYADINDETVAYIFDKMPLGDLTLYANWGARDDTPYRIEHYFENEGGVFVRNDDETEHLQGETAQYRYISAKTFEGYDFDDDNPYNYTDGEIMGDGSTVFKFYYIRI